MWKVTVDSMRGVWEGYVGGPDKLVPDVDTGIPRERLRKLAHALSTAPVGRLWLRLDDLRSALRALPA